MLQAGPMFRRAVVGYDRFQVDTYVQWAEDELVTADREREHLVARCLELQTRLEESRELLSHSAGGGEFLQVSRRIGSLLAAAADEAESMRAEAAAGRSAALAEAGQTIARAEQLLADAAADAERVRTEAVNEAAGTLTEAGRVAAEAAHRAEALRAEARAEAESRLQSVALIEERAVEQAEQIRVRAVDEAAAALLQARDEVVRMLGTGREIRRRADAEAAATRQRLEQDALTRTASLRAEVAALERRRALLRAEVSRLADRASDLAGSPLDGPLHRFLETLRWRSRTLRPH
jgi:cell division septum initiation protein DivIVA